MEKDSIKAKATDLVYRIIHKLKENWWLVVVCIFILYGVTILYKGVALGVYLTDRASNLYFINEFIAWTQGKSSICISDEPYNLSFFASAEQDYWFFLIIGLAVSIPAIRSPKTDGIRAKIGHFFPTLSESSPYMEEILLMMNKASCVTQRFHREMVITEIDGDLFKAVVNTRFKLKNLHHNHSLNHNIGNFKITPDNEAKNKYPYWGVLINFSDTNGDAICSPNKMSGDQFSVTDYNIKLGANEEREYNCNYTIWFDKKELLNISFIRFTEYFSFVILNQTVTDIKITLSTVRKNTNVVVIEETVIKEKNDLSTTDDIKDLSVEDKIVIKVDY